MATPVEYGEPQKSKGLAVVVYGHKAAKGAEIFAQNLKAAGAKDLIRTLFYVEIRTGNPDTPSFKTLYEATELDSSGLSDGRDLGRKLAADRRRFFSLGLPPLERVLHFISYQRNSARIVAEAVQSVGERLPNLPELGIVTPFSNQSLGREYFEDELVRYPVKKLGLPSIVMDDFGERVSDSPSTPTYQALLKGVAGLFAGPIALPHLNKEHYSGLVDQLTLVSPQIGVGLYEREVPTKEERMLWVIATGYSIDETKIAIPNLVREAAKPIARYTRAQRIEGSSVDVAVATLPFRADASYWRRSDLNYGHPSRPTDYNLFNEANVPSEVRLVLSPTEPLYTRRPKEVPKTTLSATHFYPVR